MENGPPYNHKTFLIWGTFHYCGSKAVKLNYFRSDAGPISRRLGRMRLNFYNKSEEVRCEADFFLGGSDVVELHYLL